MPNTLETPETDQIITSQNNNGNTSECSGTFTTSESMKARVVELRKQGLSIRQVAAQLKIPPSNAYKMMRQAVKDTARALAVPVGTISREETRAKIFKLADGMVDKVKTIADSGEKDEVQLKAALAIIDRAGFNVVDKSITISAIEEIPHDELIAGIRSALGLARTDTIPVVEVARTADTMPVAGQSMPVVNANPVTSQSMPVDSATTAAPIPPPLATPTTSRPDATP